MQEKDRALQGFSAAWDYTLRGMVMVQLAQRRTFTVCIYIFLTHYRPKYPYIHFNPYIAEGFDLDNYM